MGQVSMFRYSFNMCQLLLSYLCIDMMQHNNNTMITLERRSDVTNTLLLYYVICWDGWRLPLTRVTSSRSLPDALLERVSLQTQNTLSWHIVSMDWELFKCKWLNYNQISHKPWQHCCRDMSKMPLLVDAWKPGHWKFGFGWNFELGHPNSWWQF